MMQSIALTIWQMNDRMSNELGNTQKEVVVARFKVLSQHLPGGTEENHENVHQDSQVYAA
jgi:hypothetical protein